MTSPKVKLVVLDGYGIIFSRGYPDTVKLLNKKFRIPENQLYEIIYKKYFNSAAERKISQKQAWQKSVEELKSEFEMHLAGWIQNTVEMENQLFTKHLLNYLNEKIQAKKVKLSVGDVFSLLTSPTEESYAQKEYRGLLSIAQKVKVNKKVAELFLNNEDRIIEEKIAEYPEIDKLLNQHVIDFGWLSYQYAGPGWKKDYFISILASILRQGIDIKKVIVEENNKSEKIKSDQAKKIKELSIDQKFQQLFEIAQGIVFSKGFRKDSMFYGYYCQEFISREIARRLYLSIDQVRNIYYWELEDILLNKKKVADKLTARLNYHICLIGQKKKNVISGQTAKNFMASLEIKQEQIAGDIKELLGDCASPGKVRGIARIVNTQADMELFETGNILISISTSPDLMPAIRKSAGIITDIGGMTCHASIVSRELGKPCVVGTKIATKVIKNGDLLELNATHGKITLIK